MLYTTSGRVITDAHLGNITQRIQKLDTKEVMKEKKMAIRGAK